MSILGFGLNRPKHEMGKVVGCLNEALGNAFGAVGKPSLFCAGITPVF